MLTPRGGIECDVTVTRVEPERFYLVSAAATETHDLAWIERHAPADGSVEIANVTDRYGVLTIAGPSSRELLQRLSDDDLANEGFPFFRARHLEVGGNRVLALRVSYVGELGWELHHPLEHQRTLYDRLHEAGAGARPRRLRLPRARVDALREVLPALGRGHVRGLDAPRRPGSSASSPSTRATSSGATALLRRARRAGVSHRLSCLVVDADGADAHGYEPVYADTAKPIAYVSSGGYGHTIGKSIALAYLPVAHAAVGTELEVGILGSRRAVEVAGQPLYDPGNERLRS